MDVQLIDIEQSERAVAILFDVEPNMILSNLRSVISNQVSDIISSNSYRFLHRGVVLSRSQEGSTMLQNMATTSDDKSFMKIYLSFDTFSNDLDLLRDQKAVAESELSTSENSDAQYFDMTSTTSPLEVKSTTSALEEKSNATNVLQLRRLSDIELRKLKTFTDADIEKGKGGEREYRRFWNEEVTKMAKDRSISKNEIYKQVNERWRLKRGSLLEAETKKVEEIEKSIREAERMTADSEWQAPNTKKATISKNIKRVREATESTQRLRESVDSLSKILRGNEDMVDREEVRRNFKRAKTSLDSSNKELRKAQDTLRKNLGVKRSQLSEHL